MQRRIGWLSACGLFLVLAGATAFAQGVGSSGRIRGTVIDASGALLPDTAISIAAPQTGFQRSVVTDSSGQFQTTGLPPASYEVTAQRAGFSTEIRKGIVVGVGQTVTVDFQLKVSQVSVQVEVTSELPVVETERGSQANSVPERYIMDLPIDRRDYLTFTLLMPGVSNSNTIADNADFRVKQTPQSGLSFYGSNGRGNSVTVDGGEANDDAGGVRLNVSQDAVQEFQINRSNYAADLGGASGASINIVTKSGTNSLHGGLYGFFRNDVMDARDPFAFSPALTPGGPFSLDAQGQPIKNSLNRQQFGGTLGFPIQKDKTFGFVAYEGLRADAQDSVPLLTHSSIFAPTASQLPILEGLAAEGNARVPCISSQTGPPTFLPAAECAFGLQSILTVDPTAVGNPFVSLGKLASDAFIVNRFETDGGLFAFPIREHQFSARLDHRFSDHDEAFLRYSFAHLDESDPDVQALVGFSRGTSLLNWDSTLQGSWFHQFTPKSTNELRIQWNWYQFNITTNDPGGPGLDVQGYGFFGRGIFLPSLSTIRRYEFADNFSLIRGHHSMRMGFYELLRGNNTTSDTFFPGRFEFLQLPGGLVSPCLQNPTAFCGLPSSVSSAPLSTLQSWSLGLPAFYEQGFGDPRYVMNRPFTAAYWQDSWQIRPNLTLNYGLRYELDSQYGPLSTYKKNFSPRVSFAWDPSGDHKTVIRGGYGIFYSPIYAQIPNVVKTLGNVNGTRQIANTLVSILGLPGNPLANSAVMYQTLFAQGKILCGTPPAGNNACVTAADLAQFGIQVSNTGPLPPGTVLFSGQPNYRNPQSQQASLGIERQVGNSLSLSANYIYVHTTHLPWAVDQNLLPGAPIVTGTGADGLPTNGLPFQDWGAPQCEVDPALCFADPTHTILQNNQYSSIANAVYNGGILEVKKRFNDSFSLMANYTYSKAIDDSTDFNSDYSAFNEVDLAAERARSDFDQRHKIVVASLIESPWTKSKILSGFELAPIVSYNSGHPFNLLAGSDINGDGHFTNDRPPGAGRNSGIGPNFVSFDMRLSKSFRFGENTALRFTAEGFNITNRTNYATVNNIVGASFVPPFNVQGSASLSPSQPLGFTSALAKREIQLGARLTF
ncbi:MAG TPA: TonB-dependent receptor [Terriglobales bacterium]|nr:TonB-dependent receptor [Terriglobales bacterium]